jgi:hypothetical protein
VLRVRAVGLVKDADDAVAVVLGLVGAAVAVVVGAPGLVNQRPTTDFAEVVSVFVLCTCMHACTLYMHALDVVLTH